jgi:hypothetical protein
MILRIDDVIAATKLEEEEEEKEKKGGPGAGMPGEMGF